MTSSSLLSSTMGDPTALLLLNGGVGVGGSASLRERFGLGVTD
jgi:hypothetical protein